MRQRQQRAEIVRHDEDVEVGTRVETRGSVRLRKEVETSRIEEVVPVAVERAGIERVPAVEGDSGRVEELPDGSISIPVIEEEIVVTKRPVVRERIVVRRDVEIEERLVAEDVRRERVEIDTTGEAELEAGEAELEAG